LTFKALCLVSTPEEYKVCIHYKEKSYKAEENSSCLVRITGNKEKILSA
jgi:hypothetical protein